MREANYVIGIEIFCDRSQELLGLSQKAYINKILERLDTNKYFAGVVPIQKETNFVLITIQGMNWIINTWKRFLMLQLLEA